MRSRAAVSPPCTGCDVVVQLQRVEAGIVPTLRSLGTGTVRGAPITSRRGSCFHARQNGVKTA